MNEYIEEKQAEFIALLKLAYESKDITQSFYDYARLERCDLENWDELFDYFTAKNEELIEQLSHKEKYFLIERIEKGAAYIERTDITEAQRDFGMKLYNRLCAELEGMK